MQEPADPAELLPATQSEHPPDDAAEYLPAPHDEHTLEPAVEYWPAAHTPVHDDNARAVVAPYRPAAQLVHDGEPTKA